MGFKRINIIKETEMCIRDRYSPFFYIYITPFNIIFKKIKKKIKKSYIMSKKK